jgi:hypothetical protein
MKMSLGHRLPGDACPLLIGPFSAFVALFALDFSGKKSVNVIVAMMLLAANSNRMARESCLFPPLVVLSVAIYGLVVLAPLGLGG